MDDGAKAQESCCKRDERSMELYQNWRHFHIKIITRTDGIIGKWWKTCFPCLFVFLVFLLQSAMHSGSHTNMQPLDQHKASIWRQKKSELPSWTWQADGASDHLFSSFLPCTDILHGPFNRWMCGEKKTFHLVFFWTYWNYAAAALKQRHTFHRSSPRTNTINVIYVPNFFFFFFFIRGAWLLSDKLGSHLHRLCPRIIYHLLPLRACLGAVVAQP